MYFRVLGMGAWGPAAPAGGMPVTPRNRAPMLFTRGAHSRAQSPVSLQVFVVTCGVGALLQRIEHDKLGDKARFPRAGRRQAHGIEIGNTPCRVRNEQQ